MSYNIVSIISIVITAVVSLLLSHYFALLFLEQVSPFFKVIQLIVAVVSMTTFYAPIKFFLLKYMKIEEDLKD